MLALQIRTKWIPMVNGGAEKGARYCGQSWEVAGPSLPSLPVEVAQIGPAVQLVVRPLAAEECEGFSPLWV